jgi:cytochrome c-type biogenesis protein CcmH
MKLLHALVLLISFLWASPLWAVQPDEMLSDPALEARARALSQELRCMVCQNESIDDSDAPLAHDLRVLVRERSRPAKATLRFSTFSLPVMASSCCSSRRCPGAPWLCGACRRLCCSAESASWSLRRVGVRQPRWIVGLPV